MATERFRLDENNKSVVGGVTDDAILEIRMFRVDPVTGRLKVDASITTGLSAQTGIADGAVVDAGDKGVLILGTDGSNNRVITTDTDGDLQIDIKSIFGYNSISTGAKNVTTAGTALALAASTACKKITITAKFQNTGIIVVGDSFVVAAQATRQGTPLYAGDAYDVFIDNLADVYIDATVNGEGVTFTYFN